MRRLLRTMGQRSGSCSMAEGREVGMLAKENLTGLFHDLVRTAMATEQVRSSETSEFYLVQLLEGFARPGRGDLLDPPLAIDYLEACNLPGPARYEKLKRV